MAKKTAKIRDKKLSKCIGIVQLDAAWKQWADAVAIALLEDDKEMLRELFNWDRIDSFDSVKLLLEKLGDK